MAQVAQAGGPSRNVNTGTNLVRNRLQSPSTNGTPSPAAQAAFAAPAAQAAATSGLNSPGGGRSNRLPSKKQAARNGASFGMAGASASQGRAQARQKPRHHEAKPQRGGSY